MKLEFEISKVGCAYCDKMSFMDFGRKLKSKDKYHSNKRSSSDGRYFYVYGIPLIQEGIGKMSLASKL